jgi:nucleotidyltransferase/DNA polymerase involved in DNA repair
MHYFTCVRLESFYARELIRLLPDLESTTFVVLDSGLVLDASDDAISRGVAYGMPASQAKALLSSARFIERNPDDFRQAQLDWLDALIPFSDVLEPLDQHEAVIDLSDHPRAQEMETRAIEALSLHAPRVLTGFGESKWIARLAVEYGRSAGLRDPLDFLAPLPVQSLILLSPETREKLQLLGYRVVGSLRDVPLRVLSGQFPAEGLLIYRLAHAQHFEPVRAIYPERSLGGNFVFEGGTDSLETIGAGCSLLARQVGAKLLLEEQETSELLVHIEHESRIGSFSRTFSKPIRNELSLLASLKLLIDGKTKEPVYSLRVTLAHLKRAKRVQNGLFAQRSDGERKLSQAVAVVQNVFGEGALCKGCEIEVPRRVRLLKEMGQIVGWR